MLEACYFIHLDTSALPRITRETQASGLKNEAASGLHLNISSAKVLRRNLCTTLVLLGNI